MINLDYEIHHLNLISDNHKDLLMECIKGKDRFDIFYPNQSTTWTYDSYNVFSLTSGSELFYKLYYEIQKIVRGYVKVEEPLWLQSWMNFHKKEEVLDWHDHECCIAHGYVSINPHNTKTVFEDFEVDNEVGKLYIGKPYMKHKVVIEEEFDSPRITIAFDVINLDNYKELREKFGNNINLSHIPI